MNLTNCDREPIHIPGGIQPIGFLIACSADWIVQRAANTEASLDIKACDIVGYSIQNVFTDKAFEAIRSRVALLRSKDAVERVFEQVLTAGGEAFDIAVHFSGSTVIIEGEPSRGDQVEVSSLVRSALGRLSTCSDVATLMKEGARQFRSLMGYDRVMIYRFAPDQSGEVMSESLSDGTDSYLGLNFPATDIPQQARALYVRNTFRIITDANAEPVPLEPAGEGEPLDLSLSLFRAVSPIHLEYLRNMGVAASLSVSVVVDGKLWGLIACHHSSPRTPTFAERSAAELFGQIFSLQIESKVRLEQSQGESHARDVSARLMTAAAQDRNLLGNAEWLYDIVPDAIACDGIGVHIEGETSLSGRTLGRADFDTLLANLNRRAAQSIHHTDRIAEYVPALEGRDLPVGGMLAIPVSRRPRDYVVLFREEIIRTVRWAGDQDKSVEQGEDGPRLTPRKSFEEWSQLVRGTSAPFSASDIKTAESLRTTLLEVVLHLSESVSHERKRAYEQQQLLIAELNHRVRNILALIRALMSQTRKDGDSVEEIVGSLESRVKALANAHDLLTQDNWVPAKLRDILSTEFSAFMSERVDRVVLDGPPVEIIPQAVPIMALVIHELATNAAKYGALSDSGTVKIGWALDNARNLHLSWTESGGPAVQAPARSGFGSTIINSSIPHELGGEADVQFHPAGLRAEFMIPERHIKLSETSDETAQEGAAHGLSDSDLSGIHALLVEDATIIALDAEDRLLDLGVSQVSLAANLSQAMKLIENNTFGLAMLDFNLGNETSAPIAEKLAELGVPFFFASGYGDEEAIPREFSDRPLIVKPYDERQMREAIGKILG